MCFTTTAIFAQSLEIWVENYPPFGYEDSKTKEIKGLSVDMTRSVVKDAGIQITSFVFAPWSRVFEEAKRRPNILLSAAVVRNPEREELFHWLGPIADRNIYLFKLKNRTDIVLKSVEDAKRYRVGSVIRAASGDFLESKGIKLERVPEYTQNLRKLLLDRIDLADALDYSFAFLAKQEGVSFSKFEKALMVDVSKKYYLALSKTTSSEIVAALQKSFKKLKESGEIERIQNEYLK
ncbi:MAG: amino acid ABC transporter substrate-binding protein [Desulfobacteraceae bacterium]|nr:amino acid ABC transporter substrate-binding protein [Desulfobacteraceae bacterium]